jgi:lysozyme
VAMFGIDISSHQGSSFPVAQAVAEGYGFVFVKATEGISYVNPYFQQHVTQAKLSGAVPGAYHFLRGGDGRGQARALHAAVSAAGGPAGMLAACDNEAEASWRDTVAFYDEWQQLTGGHPLVMYTGTGWWWSARGWDGASLTPYLWDSRYVAGTGYGSELYAKVPDSWWTPQSGGWAQATILQFSSTATVAGRAIDVNMFRGTREQLISTLTKAGGQEEEEENRMLRRVDGTSPVFEGDALVRWVPSDAEFGGDYSRVQVVPSMASIGLIVGAVPAGFESRGFSTWVLANATPQASVAISAEQLELVRGDIRSAVASAVSQQLSDLAEIRSQLGALGDAAGSTLGRLNDSEQ